MRDGSEPAWITALRADAALDRLAVALASPDGFSVHLLACDTPRVAAAALEVVAARASAELGDPLPVVRLDPYDHHTAARHPIAFDVLVRTVLARLVAPDAEERAPGAVIVVDASRALALDDDAWAQCFRRLEARRDLLESVIGGPIVLCVPVRFEALFAREAPHLDGARGASAVVDVHVPVELVAAAVPGGRRHRSTPMRAISTDSLRAVRRSGSDLEAGLVAARARLAAEPEDEDALADAIAHLEAVVHHELVAGSVSRAAALAVVRVDAERRRVARRPDDPVHLLGLSFGLDAVGDARAALGELDLAAAAYEESLGLRRRVVAQDRAAVDALRALAVSHDRVGRIAGARGRRDAELGAYEEALAIRRHLASRAPGVPERVRDVVVSLDRVGDAHRARGALDRALEAFGDALAIAREHAARDPSDPAWQRALASTLDRVGDLRLARGEVGRALTVYEECLGLRRRLAADHPAQIEALRELSVALGHVGDAHVARGDLDRALVDLDEETGIARALCERDPDRASLRHDLAVALAREARLAEARGRKREARLYWAEAEGELAVLARGVAPPAAWGLAHAACEREIARLDADLRGPGPGDS